VQQLNTATQLDAVRDMVIGAALLHKGPPKDATEKLLRAVLEALPTAIYTTDAAGRITYYNEAAAHLWGCRPELGKSEWCGSWKIFTTDGVPMPHAECPMAVALKEARPVRGAEAVAQRPDGTFVPFRPFPTPLFDEDGRLTGAVNMLIDITAEKDAIARQQLLINELNHRVKNTLATVQSIASQTLRHTPSSEDFQTSFTSRLVALSRAHDLLTAENWEGARLRDVLAHELAPHGGALDRIEMDGPDVELGPRTALSLAMAFHELATNAAKYGALSNNDGRLSVVWSEEGRRLVLTWTETGGPKVEPPSRRGFGSRLIERSITHELRGELSVDYAPQGLRCRLSAPLKEDVSPL
jgi:PAS domain S-box-containing protein